MIFAVFTDIFRKSLQKGEESYSIAQEPTFDILAFDYVLIADGLTLPKANKFSVLAAMLILTSVGHLWF